MLDGSFLAVRRLDLCFGFFLACAGSLVTHAVRFGFAYTGELTAYRTFLTAVDRPCMYMDNRRIVCTVQALSGHHPTQDH